MKEYPTDEQLEIWIRELEQQELYAPKHLKQQILEQAFPKQTAEPAPDSKRKSESVRLFTYRLKIIAGMAAAILMLILIPMQGADRSRYPASEPVSTETEAENSRKESQVELNRRLNEHTRNMNRTINWWLEQAINRLNGDNGGDLNEN